MYMRNDPRLLGADVTQRPI